MPAYCKLDISVDYLVKVLKLDFNAKNDYYCIFLLLALEGLSLWYGRVACLGAQDVGKMTACKKQKNKNWHTRSPRRIRQWRRSIPNSRASTNTNPGQPTSREGAGGSDLKISQTDETDCETHSALALAASASHGGSSMRKQFVAAIQKVSVNEPPLCTRPPTASVLGTHPHTRDSKRRRQPLSLFSLLHLVRVGGRWGGAVSLKGIRSVNSPCSLSGSLMTPRPQAG